MAVETLGEAFSLGWRISARCAWGKRESMKSVRECTARYELDLQTLIIARLESRLKCPRCGSRRVVLLFDLPAQPKAARA